MYLMELIIKVLKVKSREITVLIINTFIIVIFYYLLFENSEVIYPLILSGFIILIYFISETIKYKSFMDKLEDSKKSPNYRYSNVNLSEEEILDSINDIHKDYIEQIDILNQEIRERDTLFSQWIHNMKTSITVIDLACEKRESNSDYINCIEDIKEENSSLKKNLEECLNILRLDDFSRDYITDPCNLKELVNNVVNSKKRDFIYKGVFPKVTIDEDIYVYTDKKWCGYMLEQIISNSIKYSKSKNGNKIEILAKYNDTTIELLIKDEGIGISKEDLPRVFDSFFTGNNGRTERNASGIGLYMVKLISKKLGHDVEIESELEVGTQVKVILKNLSRM